MVSYHDLIKTFRSFGFRRETPIITHIGRNLSLKVNGGISTFMGALLTTVDNILLPAFTYSTMVVPHQGPPDNAMEYGTHDAQNAHAAIFTHTLPSECGNQDAIDILKAFPAVYRSAHPIFSFYGLGLDIALLNQTPQDPYFPIRKMRDLNGWVLLADAGQPHNFSIHFAEMLAGRKQFTRWALTMHGAAECPYFPGCPDGFHKLDFYLHDELRNVRVNELQLSAAPLQTMINTTIALIKEDPFALLCNKLDCAKCNLVREAAKTQIRGLGWQKNSIE
jgi:aminoglycoside 3-N-acetyltransferase